MEFRGQNPLPAPVPVQAEIHRPAVEQQHCRYGEKIGCVGFRILNSRNNRPVDAAVFGRHGLNRFAGSAVTGECQKKGLLYGMKALAFCFLNDPFVFFNQFPQKGDGRNRMLTVLRAFRRSRGGFLRGSSGGAGA